MTVCVYTYVPRYEMRSWGRGYLVADKLDRRPREGDDGGCFVLEDFDESLVHPGNA